MKKRKDKLDKSLIRSVDEVLKEIFGEAGAKIIYAYLWDNYSLRQEEIPEKLKDFEKGLKKLLSSGAWVTERMVLKNLYTGFGLEYRNETDHSFLERIAKLKEQL